MKKIFGLVAISALLMVACSKKENTVEESNTMLAEPEVAVTDSSSVVKPADQTAVATSDSAKATVDSAATK